MPSQLVRAALAVALLMPAVALAQDQDGDGSSDVADYFPCDAQFTSLSFAPAEGVMGQVSFEDEWPAQSDVDFNDVVVGYNYVFRSNANGVVEADLTFDVIAAGGILDNGLGLALNVPASALASATRTVSGTPALQIFPSPGDTNLTLVLSDNIREFFGGTAGQINSRSDLPRVDGTSMTVHLVFASAVAIDPSKAPFDLFIRRTAIPSHEIHLSQFSGTSNMNQSLFGSGNDASSPTRSFVDVDGLPYALAFPGLTEYPLEGVAISSLMPDILGFAASGGMTNSDFYVAAMDNSKAYLSPSSLGPLAPVASVSPSPDRSCIPVPGTSLALAGTSCLSLFQSGVTTDGAYWIDPQGTGPFNVFCDMTRDGGGWTLVWKTGPLPTSAYLSSGTIGSGNLTNTDVSVSGTSKLADATINALRSSTGYVAVYRLDMLQYGVFQPGFFPGACSFQRRTGSGLPNACRMGVRDPADTNFQVGSYNQWCNQSVMNNAYFCWHNSSDILLLNRVDRYENYNNHNYHMTRLWVR